ncbi:AAA family ATPase [Gemmatimonadota bacterium]
MSTETARTALETADDVALAERMNESQQKVITEIGKVIIGQEDVVEQVLITLFVGGNSMITGVPGLAKTLLIWTMAEVMDLDFKRIQFTPDLMPSDITGTEIIQEDADTGRRKLVFMRGPVFTNILLADEINRTPPKTQSALLEAMEEHQVTVQGQTYKLDEPFFVFATQNPIELEGTYPLPEAQLDRFMFNIIIDYMPLDDELEVIRSTTAVQDFDLSRAVTGEELLSFQRLVRKVPAPEEVIRYAVDLARTTRPGGPDTPDFITRWVDYGGSVRAAQYLILAGKARALMAGRYSVSFDDVKAVAKPVFRHRILTNFHAEAERVTTDQLVEDLLEVVPVPSSGM